jgi:HlyD family secretion protein
MTRLKSYFSKNGKKRIYLSVVFIAAIAIILVAVFLNKASSNPSRHPFVVKRMDINIVVTEEGVLQAKESEKIIPNIDAEAKIISVVDEGAYVKKDSILVELDKTGLQTKLDSLSLEMISAEAELNIADEEVKKYEQGEYPQKIKELEFAIEKAQAQLDKAKEEMPKETNSNVYSKSEIRDAQIKVNEAQMTLDKAIMDKQIFIDFTHKKNMLEKKTDADTARQKYQSKLTQQKDYQEQLTKMTLVAPCDGLVIYGGGGDSRRYRGEEVVIKVGALVYKGQVVITLPNVSLMQVQARIHEVDIQKIKDKQPVSIRIDAFPDLSLTGKVESIGALAHDRDWRTQGVKVFDVTIDIDGNNEKLRPGMTAKVSIKVNEIKNVLAIPIECVFDDPETKTKYCFVLEGETPVKRVIELGASDDNFVEVKSGLVEGEMVYQYDVSEEAGL